MLTLVDHKYKHGDIVYIIVDEEQIAYIVVEIIISPGGAIQYTISGVNGLRNFYEFELSSERDYVKTIT